MPVKPMLDDLELELVQEIETDEQQVRAQHPVPALEGDFLQPLGRRAAQITLNGILAGEEVGDQLKKLHEKFRLAQPVPFVADIATATRVGQVLIEEMGVRELAGKPGRFEYAFTLREYLPPPQPEEVPPTPVPPIRVVESDLTVEVVVEGRPEFDYSTVTVTVRDAEEDGGHPTRILTGREENIWTERPFPEGRYIARAEVTGTDAMANEEPVEVMPGQSAYVRITLRPGSNLRIARYFMVHYWFDKAFIEPSMRQVLRQVVEYGRAHADEKLVILGHTDESGLDSYNQPLSERRARGAYAFLSFGDSARRAAALAEWNELRQARPVGTALSTRDTWGVREYQMMLQDLGYYSGNITGVNDDPTRRAVEAFQQQRGLAVDGVVGDQTWPALIEDYLAQDNFNFPESQLMPNRATDCDAGVVRWLGCGEEMPVSSTPRGQCGDPAWRPNRRTEFLFVQASEFPCGVLRPATLGLSPADPVNAGWCLDQREPRGRRCFVTRETEEPDKWLASWAENTPLTVAGSMRFEDGSPAANIEYVLIAPDGEFMDGEHICRPDKGVPITGRTGANGQFGYPASVKTSGVYSVEVRGPYLARWENDPPSAARGCLVGVNLRGQGPINIILSSPGRTFHLAVSGARETGGAGSGQFLALRSPGGAATVEAVFPPGQAVEPNGISWSGGAPVPGSPLQRSVSLDQEGQVQVSATLLATGETRSVEIFVVRVTLDVDADRDGVVEQDAEGKNGWEGGPGKKGAVILNNNDDDDINHRPDSENTRVDTAADLPDLAQLVVRQSGALPAGVELALVAPDPDFNRIKVFNGRAAGSSVVIGPPPLPAEFVIPASAAADTELGIEALQYPDAAFDGMLHLALVLREGTTELARDEVVLRVAPWLMPSQMQETTELYVVETADNSGFVSDIAAIAAASGLPLVRTASIDRWIQDAIEVGYSQMPGLEQNVVVNTIQDRELRPFAPDQLLGPDYGLSIVTPTPGGSTFDSYGNLEVSPPVRVNGSSYPLGRIYFGRGRPPFEPLSPLLREFLMAQAVQAPFPIDTDWLNVGHVDEITSFVPDNSVEEGFKLLFSDTLEARRILLDLQAAGHGALEMFAGKRHHQTVDQMLADLADTSPGHLGWANDFCQGRLDGVKTVMRTELGLKDEDFVMIPALFMEADDSPLPLVSSSIPVFDALIPGMVNLLLINRPVFSQIQLVIAKPFGPTVNGADPFEQDVLNKLAALGYTTGQVHFVDDYVTYHLKQGEVHCGTNSRRRPPAQPWWEQV